MLLSGDETLKALLSQDLGLAGMAPIETIIADCQSRYSDPMGYVISRCRAELVDGILKEASLVNGEGVRTSSLMDRLGRWSMHPVAGIPFLLAVIFVFYQVVGVFGAGVAVNFTESVVFGEYVNPGATRLFDLVPIPILQELMVGEFGLITIGLTYSIAIIMPIMVFFFLLFGILEDTGYLPRLTIFVNHAFNRIGLSVKVSPASKVSSKSAVPHRSAPFESSCRLGR